MDTVTDRYAIRVSDLVVGFGRRIVIDHLSLDVRKGEILGLVGASGGGKSVLMRTIIGLIPKLGGSIEVMGWDADAAGGLNGHFGAPKWGILFQQGALFSSLTVRQNVQFPMREYLDLSDRLLDEIAVAKLEMVGLTADVTEKFPAELTATATSLRAQTGRAQSRMELLVRLLREFENDYNHFLHEGAASVTKRFEAVSSYARGKRVSVSNGMETYAGVTAGLSREGLLQVERESGDVVTVIAGDVREAV